MIVDEIKYNVTDEDPYSSDIFTAGKGVIDFDRAVKADKHITPFVVVDSDTETFIERAVQFNSRSILSRGKFSFQPPS